MTETIVQIVAKWREVGPVAWSQSTHGWITEEQHPIELTPFQRAVLEAWWDHRFEVSTLAISAHKKIGKTLANAALVAWRWLALPGLHVAAANDEAQAIGRVFSEISAMVGRNPFLSKRVDVSTRRLVFRPTGSVLEAWPMDAAGAAGGNWLTTSHTEAWGIIYPLAVKFWSELTPPPGHWHGGFPALRIADSYSGYDPESKTWHDLVDRLVAGEPLPGEWPLFKAGGLLGFAAEGEAWAYRLFRGSREEAEAYYAEQRRSLRPPQYARMHRNERVAAEGGFVEPEAYDAIIDHELRPLEPGNHSLPLFVGLDVGLKSDTTALLALAPDGEGRARVAWHRVWKPRKGETLSLSPVREFLREANAHYWLAGLRFDPSQAQRLAEELVEDGIQGVREIPQSPAEMGPRGSLLFDAIRNGWLRVYPDEELRSHFLNAIGREVLQGVMLRKASGARKVDLAVASSFVIKEALDEASAPPPGAMAEANAGLRRPSRWGGGDWRDLPSTRTITTRHNLDGSVTISDSADDEDGSWSSGTGRGSRFRGRP